MASDKIKAAIIAMFNNKGGVTKTTTIVNLAYELSKKKKRVLVVDMDEQGNASSILSEFRNTTEIEVTVLECLTKLGPEQVKEAIYPSKYKNLDIICGDTRMTALERELSYASKNPTIFLERRLRHVAYDYDYILIDCPSSLALATELALVAADYYISPFLSGDSFSMQGIEPLFKKAAQINRDFKEPMLMPELTFLGAFLAQHDQRYNACKFTEEVLKASDLYLFKTYLGSTVEQMNANLNGIPLSLYNAKSALAVSYKNLANEIIQRVKELSNA